MTDFNAGTLIVAPAKIPWYRLVQRETNHVSPFPRGMPTTPPEHVPTPTTNDLRFFNFLSLVCARNHSKVFAQSSCIIALFLEILRKLFATEH
jgi:hypothetical protein